MKKDLVINILCALVTDTAETLEQKTGRNLSHDCFCGSKMKLQQPDITFCVDEDIIQFIVDTVHEALHPAKAPVGHPMNLQWED